VNKLNEKFGEEDWSKAIIEEMGAVHSSSSEVQKPALTYSMSSEEYKEAEEALRRFGSAVLKATISEVQGSLQQLLHRYTGTDTL
jgi:hypothetical protein